MTKDIYFVADLFANDINGGGELNNEELINIYLEKGINIKKKYCKDINIDFLKHKKDEYYIIANFISLSEESKKFLQDNCRYVIYEHDHKYLRNRNPAHYYNFIAPKNEIINQDFFRHARAVFCQSSFHEEIIKKNLDINNIINLSGNLWSLEQLDLISDFNKKEKKNLCAILDSQIWHKNTFGSIEYCNKNNIAFELIKDNNYLNFLKKLSQYTSLVFIPQTPETLSRLVIEARMLGLTTYTNKLVGASYESWYQNKSDNLVNIMKLKREEISNKVLGALNV